ncbi:hypothetical protein ABTM67_19085, partial [Acinetobacter baumannii]
MNDLPATSPLAAGPPPAGATPQCCSLALSPDAVLVLAGEDWTVDPALERAVRAALARHGVLPSIELGGM